MKPAPYPGAALLAWLRIAANHGGVSPGKLHHAVPWLVRYVLLEPCRIYEAFKYDRRIAEHRLSLDPIFVLGHWRSGTSYLQELMTLDARYATCSLFQCLFPECSLSTRRWLPTLIDLFASAFGIRYHIQDRPLRSGLPAEEEIAMLCMTDPECSNWGQLFPTRMQQHLPNLDADQITDMGAWLEGYRYVVNKLSIAHGHRRLILKSPMNTARLPLLLEAYPDAKFIHIYRHPLDVFASSRRLWGMILQQSALQKMSGDSIDRLIEDLYAKLMRRYLNDRHIAASEQLIEVSYERLKADPVAVLSDVYAALQLGELPVDDIKRFTRDTPAPAGKARSIEPALERQLRSRWKFAFEAWHYE